MINNKNEFLTLYINYPIIASLLAKESSIKDLNAFFDIKVWDKNNEEHVIMSGCLLKEKVGKKFSKITYYSIQKKEFITLSVKGYELLESYNLFYSFENFCDRFDKEFLPDKSFLDKVWRSYRDIMLFPRQDLSRVPIEVCYLTKDINILDNKVEKEISFNFFYRNTCILTVDGARILFIPREGYFLLLNHRVGLRLYDPISLYVDVNSVLKLKFSYTIADEKEDVICLLRNYGLKDGYATVGRFIRSYFSNPLTGKLVCRSSSEGGYINRCSHHSPGKCFLGTKNFIHNTINIRCYVY